MITAIPSTTDAPQEAIGMRMRAHLQGVQRSAGGGIAMLTAPSRERPEDD
jgi:hypothetical protein